MHLARQKKWKAFCRKIDTKTDTFSKVFLLYTSMPVIIATSNTATITLIAALRFDDVFCFSIYLRRTIQPMRCMLRQPKLVRSFCLQKALNIICFWHQMCIRDRSKMICLSKTELFCFLLLQKQRGSFIICEQLNQGCFCFE